MVNKNLRSICEELNVSDRDMKKMRNEYVKEKFWYPIMGAIGAAVSLFFGALGFFVGKGSQPEYPGYPFLYMAGLASASVASKSGKSFLKGSIIAIAIASIIGFVIGHSLGTQPNPVPMYNVYKRN